MLSHVQGQVWVVKVARELDVFCFPFSVGGYGVQGGLPVEGWCGRLHELAERTGVPRLVVFRRYRQAGCPCACVEQQSSWKHADALHATLRAAAARCVMRVCACGGRRRGARMRFAALSTRCAAFRAHEVHPGFRCTRSNAGCTKSGFHTLGTRLAHSAVKPRLRGSVHRYARWCALERATKRRHRTAPHRKAHSSRPTVYTGA